MADLCAELFNQLLRIPLSLFSDEKNLHLYHQTKEYGIVHPHAT